MEKENFRKNNQIGITLIALVVTIVILLILTGVTINMLLGENGIIRTAQEAKNTWENAIAKEQEELNNLTNELNEELTDRSGDIYVFLYKYLYILNLSRTKSFQDLLITDNRRTKQA